MTQIVMSLYGEIIARDLVGGAYEFLEAICRQTQGNL